MTRASLAVNQHPQKNSLMLTLQGLGPTARSPFSAAKTSATERIQSGQLLEVQACSPGQNITCIPVVPHKAVAEVSKIGNL